VQDFLSGETANIRFLFGSGDEPVIPDVGSVTYTVLSAIGNPIVGLENVPIATDTGTFATKITIPAEYNVILPGKTFDRRTIIVRYTAKGVEDWQRINYRLIPSVPFTVTPATVRAFLGVNKGELPDEDIDLFSAYVYVQEAVSDPSLLTAALSSGDKLELTANDVIAMRAAIDIIPSLQNRVAQAEKNGVMGYDRIKIKDFAGLLADAYGRYYAGLELVGAVDESVGIPTTLLITTTDTDPITAGT
jgi:hypothetical protein